MLGSSHLWCLSTHLLQSDGTDGSITAFKGRDSQSKACHYSYQQQPHSSSTIGSSYLDLIKRDSWITTQQSCCLWLIRQKHLISLQRKEPDWFSSTSHLTVTRLKSVCWWLAPEAAAIPTHSCLMELLKRSDHRDVEGNHSETKENRSTWRQQNAVGLGPSTGVT